MKSSAGHPIHLLLGLVIWGGWFVALYGGLSVGCELAPPSETAGPMNWLNASLAGLTLLTVGLLLFLSGWCWRARRGHDVTQSPDQQGHYLAGLSAALYLLSATATLFIGLPILILPPCV